MCEPSTIRPHLKSTHMEYDIDDVDGALYMLEHGFSGTLVIEFDRPVKEEWGKVVCEGKILPEGIFKTIPLFGNAQMIGIPVRDTFTLYDRNYELRIFDFADEDGRKMDPETITVHTLPAAAPDPAYEDNDAIALQAAREGIVLLKNRDHLLPLAEDAKLSVLHENDFRSGAVGAGKINPRYTIRLGRALSEYSRIQRDPDADTALYVVSRPSGENFDNLPIPGYFYLTKKEEEELAELKQKGKKIIALINTGYPIDLRWLGTLSIDAAIWCGFPGMLGGRAIVEILDGRVNPSGKLPDTWSLDYFDIPAAQNFYCPDTEKEALDADCGVFVDTVYEEGIYVGYRYFETFHKQVAYSFGFGLSYTNFSIRANLSGDLDSPRVTALITNKGTCPGKEILQVYVSIPEKKLEQPSRRLAGFAKTKELAPGATQELSLQIDNRELTSFDEEKAAWIMEEGDYVFYAGNNIQSAAPIGTLHLDKDRLIRQSEHLCRSPSSIDVFSRRKGNFPSGALSGIREGANALFPVRVPKKYTDEPHEKADFVDTLSSWELARLCVCASHGWGMHEKGEAGRIFQIDGLDLPSYVVADGNNGVNVKKKNIGMPCSNIVCATWNTDIAYAEGSVIAKEAKENGINMILAPAMNIHRNPLNGRHPEYFSEDPYLSGVMAGFQSKGLEDNGVSSCVKHVAGNNCETSRKRNHSLIPERALREIYLKTFEVALSVHQPDSIMTGYNALNGCYCASDEELLMGRIFRREFHFTGFVMTDWNSYDSAGVVLPVAAGNSWMTPGTHDDTYVRPILDAQKRGDIDLNRLRENVRYLLFVVQKQTGKDLGVW